MLLCMGISTVNAILYDDDDDGMCVCVFVYLKVKVKKENLKKVWTKDVYNVDTFLACDAWVKLCVSQFVYLSM